MSFRFRARWRLLRLLAALVVVGLVGGSTAQAQSEHVHMMTSAPAEPAWAWSWDANVFAGVNYQLRKFTDFNKVESQNWLMGAGERRVGRELFRLHSMLSFEPFTIQALGSPQVFQTGETYQDAPLIDYQHPHDLVMDLGADWARPVPRGRVFIELYAVGAPALGPVAFMHRASAVDNPTAPLGHHQMDATHISHGVATAGIQQGTVSLEGSWFHGAEPDENRTAVEFGRLDSVLGTPVVEAQRLGRPGECGASHDARVGRAVLGRDQADGFGGIHASGWPCSRRSCRGDRTARSTATSTPTCSRRRFVRIRAIPGIRARNW